MNHDPFGLERLLMVGKRDGSNKYVLIESSNGASSLVTS